MMRARIEALTVRVSMPPYYADAAPPRSAARPVDQDGQGGRHGDQESNGRDDGFRRQ